MHENQKVHGCPIVKKLLKVLTVNTDSISLSSKILTRSIYKEYVQVLELREKNPVSEEALF